MQTFKPKLVRFQQNATQNAVAQIIFVDKMCKRQRKKKFSKLAVLKYSEGNLN